MTYTDYENVMNVAPDLFQLKARHSKLKIGGFEKIAPST